MARKHHADRPNVRPIITEMGGVIEVSMDAPHRWFHSKRAGGGQQNGCQTDAWNPLGLGTGSVDFGGGAPWSNLSNGPDEPRQSGCSWIASCKTCFLSSSTTMTRQRRNHCPLDADRAGRAFYSVCTRRRQIVLLRGAAGRAFYSVLQVEQIQKHIPRQHNDAILNITFLHSDRYY